MSPVRGMMGPFGGRFPRVSGDEPHAQTPERIAWLFSPRERG